MDIFISWHGQRGKAAATALEDWLPQIVNAFNPWCSPSTEKGSRWRSEVADRVAKAKVGIIVLTPSALSAPWLLFEAGAIAKSSEKTYACTLLIDLKNEEVVDPLAQFQHTAATKEELFELVKTLNTALEREQRPVDQVQKAFNKWWPDLEEALKKLPPDEPAKSPHRDSQELLAELVNLARSTNRGVETVHLRIADRFERFSEVTQKQIDYLINFLTTISSLSPTELGSLSSLRGGPAASPGAKVAKALGEADALRDRLREPSGKPQKK